METHPIQADTESLGHGLDYAEEVGNYYGWLADTFAPYLREATSGSASARKIVEHGAGVGTLSELLLERNVGSMALTEPDPKLAGMLRTKFGERSEAEVFHGTLEGFLAERGSGKVDAIVSSNVLEHVVDDEACLAAMWQLLRPGGTLALYVPARPELYSEFDRQVGHQRRYRRGELGDKLDRAGFRTRTLKYRNLIGALGWLLMGRLLKTGGGAGKGSVWLYDKVLFPASRVVEDRIAPPYGLNLLAIADKP